MSSWAGNPWPSSRRELPRSAFAIQQVRTRAVGAQDGVEYPARTLAGLQHHRAGRIPEKNAGIPVRPIHDARHHLRADHQHRPRIHLHQTVNHPLSGVCDEQFFTVE